MGTVAPAEAVHLPGDRWAGHHRGQRRQRCGGHRDLRLGGLAVRLSQPVLHGSGHHRPGTGAGDGGPPGRPYREGARRADSRAVQPAPHRPRAGLRPARQHGIGRVGVRGHRSGVRAARGEPLPGDPDRGGLDLGAGHLRLLSLRGTDLPGALAGVLGLPDRGHPGASELGSRGERSRGAAPIGEQCVPAAARGRPDRYHGQPVHAALRGGRRGRPGRRTPRITVRRDWMPSAGRCSRASSR